MPIYMRVPKQRGSTSKDALPIGPHRTATQPVNIRDLERVFGEGTEVTLDGLVESGLVKNLRVDIKILGDGEITKKLSVTAHRFSASARQKIEAAGGTVVELKPPSPSKRRRSRVERKDAADPADRGEEPSEESTQGSDSQTEE